MKNLNRLLVFLGAYCFNIAILLLAFFLFAVLEDELFSPFPWKFMFICSAVIVGTQFIFILPIVKPPRLTIRGKPLLLSACMASFIAAVLTLGLVSLVYSIVMTLALDVPKEDEMQEGFFLIFLGSSWIVWTICLLVFVNRKKRDPSSIVKCTSWLFAGSIIELLLSIPLAILVARRSNCYCSTGSFFSLSLSFLAALWLFGPFMVILLVWRRRPWTKDHCFNCGYPRKLADSSVCSECGTEI
jgi:hypothetical protein